jgi:Domain of unknown function (DUF4266)
VRASLRAVRPVPSRLVILVLLFVGCRTVAPYERETLARPDMALGGEGELGSGEEHARAYCEGSIGGAAIAGGGCGCN